MKMNTQVARLPGMKTTKTAHEQKQEQARMEMAKLLECVGARGFHGTASLTLSVQDGHIQHLRIAVDRMIR